MIPFLVLFGHQQCKYPGSGSNQIAVKILKWEKLRRASYSARTPYLRRRETGGEIPFLLHPLDKPAKGNLTLLPYNRPRRSVSILLQ